MLTNYIRFVGYLSPDGGTGRRAGFKIQFWQQVWVRSHSGYYKYVMQDNKKQRKYDLAYPKWHWSGQNFLTVRERMLER